MIYFLIPTYNEEKNIPNLFAELQHLLPLEQKHFIFSDDGSSDQTISTIEQFFGSSATVIGDGVNRGPGYAFNVGFEWILNHSSSPKDVVVTLEADCTSDVSFCLICSLLVVWDMIWC
jgi:glycosyltransferase involved in cell wall biosynthesis